MLNAGKFSSIADGNDEAIVWVCTVVGNLERGRSGERDMRVRDAASVTRCFASTAMICFTAVHCRWWLALGTAVVIARHSNPPTLALIESSTSD
jgi:hypothetical protein